MKIPRTDGFSLIELMIAVAIIGILAAAAIPAYRGYVENSNMAKVNVHYKQGVRFIENEFRRMRSEISMGTLTTAQADVRYTNPLRIDALNGEGGKAPSGADAYAETVDHVGGVVGVSITGTIAGNDLVVTIIRPMFGDFATAETRDIAWADV